MCAKLNWCTGELDIGVAETECSRIQEWAGRWYCYRPCYDPVDLTATSSLTFQHWLRGRRYLKCSSRNWDYSARSASTLRNWLSSRLAWAVGLYDNNDNTVYFIHQSTTTCGVKKNHQHRKYTHGVVDNSTTWLSNTILCRLHQIGS